LLGLLPLAARKVLRDLGRYRGRTTLVVLSIAVGVFGVGVIAGTRQVLSRELDAGFAAIRPSNATITVTEPFDDSVVRAIEKMPEVGLAEGRRAVIVRLQVGEDEWKDLQLVAIPDFENMATDRVFPEEGAWPPADRELLIERSGLRLLLGDLTLGQDVVIKAPDGRQRTLRFSGTAHDQYALLYALDGVAYGYVNYDTLTWLGLDQSYNELRVVAAERANDKEHVDGVIAAVRDRIEEGGRTIFYMQVPEPGTHPLGASIEAILLMLGAIGVLALLLSGLLVTNTVSAILTQEIRQIGIMKAIGGRGRQVGGMYLMLVLAYGLLALGIALPLGLLGTSLFTNVIADFLNVNVASAHPPAWVIAMQAGVALVVPMAAAAGPLGRAARITVNKAVSSYGLGTGRYGKGRLDRGAEWVLEHGLPWLGRPVRLALRNTIRRKLRLFLTLTTLTLAGGIFIAIMSVREGLDESMDGLLALWNYDLWAMLEEPYRSEQMIHEITQVPGVEKAEGWGFVSARIIDEEEQGLGEVFFGFIMPTMVFAPPAETELLKPTLLRGRWLLPEDESAVVVNTDLLKKQPKLDLGDTMTLRMWGRDSDWTIVGVTQSPIPSPMAYVNYPHFTRVTRNTGRAASVMIVTEPRDEETQAVMARQIEDRLQRSGVRVMLVSVIAQERREATTIFTGIIALMLAVSLLLAVVGGLGLAGTMSLNVLERTREIGVMRAIGASTSAVLRIVLVEGLTIGVLSWGLGVALAAPLAWGLGRAIGITLLGLPLAWVFSATGALAWLIAVLLLSLVASTLPAWSASKVSVREALTYE
jgi:putative ABC transport system permease protein